MTLTTDDVRMAEAHRELLDAYRQNHKDAVKAGDRAEADRWARSLRDLRRLDRRLVVAPSCLSTRRRGDSGAVVAVEPEAAGVNAT